MTGSVEERVAYRVYVYRRGKHPNVILSTSKIRNVTKNNTIQERAQFRSVKMGRRTNIQMRRNGVKEMR